MCTVLLPGCRDKARSDFLGLSRAALSSSLVVSVGVSAFPRLTAQTRAWPGTAAALTLSGQTGLPKPSRGTQTDRRTGLTATAVVGRCWKTPDISLSPRRSRLLHAKAGASLSKLNHRTNARELHSYRAVCWPNSLIFFLTADFFNDQTASSFNVIRPDVIPRRLSLCALKNFGEKF